LDKPDMEHSRFLLPNSTSSNQSEESGHCPDTLDILTVSYLEVLKSILFSTLSGTEMLFHSIKFQYVPVYNFKTLAIQRNATIVFC